MEHITIITNRKLNAMLEAEEQSGRIRLEWCGERDYEGHLYTVYKDEPTGKLYGVPTVRTVHMGFNSNDEGKVEEFVSIVEREGACQASWGVTGRTKHLYLANQLAKSLPQYEWELSENYGCKAMKK